MNSVHSAPALEFLQSVVMFDDKAYDLPVLDQVESAANDDEIYGGLSPHDPATELTGEPEDQEGFDTQAVVRGFADKGMTCAVLAPSAGDPVGDTERFLSLSRRADVVILDWLIDQGVPTAEGRRPASQNRTSLQLLIEVLHNDQRLGSRLRLMCIYSGAFDLKRVQVEVRDALKEAFPGSAIEMKDAWLDIGDARIVFISKDDGGVKRAGAVAAADLPTRVVQEFSQFAARGILPELALRSLSTVRDQAHRVLRRFRSDLDPTLLAHRAMTSPEGTEEFVVDLIGDELSAIVANGHVTSLLNDAAIHSHIVRMLDGALETFYWHGRSKEVKPNSLAPERSHRVLLEGPNSSYNFVADGTTTKFQKSTSLTSLSMQGDAAQVRNESKRIDLEFAMLSALGRDGGLDGGDTSPPELRLGSILILPAKVRTAGSESRTGARKPKPYEADRFFLCLQPLCDSTRLKAHTSFPLLPLSELGPDIDNFGLVVKSGELRVLSHELKLGLMESSKFRPDSRTQSVLAKWDGQNWIFVSGARKFIWLGNLRTDKAHRIANSLASDAGRVGINEYEYYRRRHE